MFIRLYVAICVGLCCGICDWSHWVRSDEVRKDRPKSVANDIGMKFVWIPPGTFLMGSPENEKGRMPDEVQHKVTLTKAFYMGIHLVTQEQWRAVMRNDRSTFLGKRHLPVEKVSWDDCQEFCKKLRNQDKRKYRLPTEAEWEYVCRAGTKGPFSFGNTISTGDANYDGNRVYDKGKKGVYRETTTPVGTFAANAWGIHDMHGNVWEWCQDWKGEATNEDVSDPQGPNVGEYRFLRGGSWFSNPDACRSASRSWHLPDYCANHIGFRVCFFPE